MNRQEAITAALQIIDERAGETNSRGYPKETVSLHDRMTEALRLAAFLAESEVER